MPDSSGGEQNGRQTAGRESQSLLAVMLALEAHRSISPH